MDPETESSGPTLRDQFQHIQEQQRERYKHRKTSKLGSKENSDAVGQGHSAHETRFGKQNDLELKTATKELKATVVCGPATEYRDEKPVNTKEVDFLHRQLEQLQLENAQLHVSLKGREHDVLELQRMREEEKVALGGVSSTATQRIVELSKKNRELTAELTAEKNKVRQLQRRLKEAEGIQPSASEPQKTSGVSLAAQQKSFHSGATTLPQKKSSDIESLPELAQLQEQLTQAKQKVTDYRNQCQLLKQDLKVAHKVLAQEVGEGISVSALLSGVGSWKGRAHQIVVLQNKVAELKQQLERAQNDPSSLQTSRSENRTPGQVDVRQKATLQKIETERKRNLEDTRLELESLKSEYAKVQQQYNALKARNKTLTSDVKSLRSQLTTMLEKSAHSEKQVQAMTEKSSSSGKDETRGEKGRDVQEWEHERDVLQQANHSLQTQLCKCLAELQSLREMTPATRSSNSTPSREGHDVSVSDAQVSLPPIVPPPSNRKPHRPPTRTIVRKSLSAGQLSTQQFNCDLVEAQTVAKIAQVERDRLLELTSTLQLRLDATTDKLVRLETEVCNQRQHGTKPEKQLHTGQSRSTGNSHGSRQHGGSKVAGETGRKQSVRELESKLALQQDENVVLKETLELTRHEKMEDMKLLHGMLREAKQLFMDSVRKLRSE